MKIHFYGVLDSLESCYTFQEFEKEGVTILLQNAPSFGYEPVTMTIKNPALFIKTEKGYYRFVIEDFGVTVVNGLLEIDDNVIKEIVEEAKKKI